MYDLLLKRNYIAIVPSKDTYFYTTSLPKNTKLSKDLLKLNYEKHSPFKPQEIITVEEKTELLLWFCKKSISAPVAIPEDYLLYQILKTEHQNALFLLETPECKKALVIKEGRLRNAFVMEIADPSFLEMSKDEYGVHDVIEYNLEQYLLLAQRSLKLLNLPLLYKFSQISLDPKELVEKTIEQASYPISFLLLFAVLINFYHNSSLQKEIDTLTQSYQDVRQGNQDLIDTMYQHNQEVELYEEFISKELLYADPLLLLEKLYGVLEENEESSLYSLSATQGKLSVKIQTSKSPVELLNKLAALSDFERVLLGDTHRPKGKAPIYTYNIALKPLGVAQ